MIPKTDVEKLLELYKHQDKQTTFLEKNNKELVNLIQQLVNLIGIMNMDIMDLRSRVKELEKDRNS